MTHGARAKRLGDGGRLTLTATRGNAPLMSDQSPSQKTWGGRFRGAASDLMTRINASISFDKKLLSPRTAFAAVFRIQIGALLPTERSVSASAR